MILTTEPKELCIYVFMHEFVCACVCVCMREKEKKKKRKRGRALGSIHAQCTSGDVYRIFLSLCNFTATLPMSFLNSGL